MKFLIAPFCLAAILTRCDDDSSRSYVHESRQNLAPAATAEEWAERAKIDSKHYQILENLYAELPPAEQWPKAFELAKPHFKSRDQVPFKIFQLLLEKKNTEALTEIKKQVKSSQISDYKKDDVVELLYAVSGDSESTKAWIAKEKPSLLKKKPSSRSDDKDEKTAWETALANNEVEKGISLLWDSIKGASKSEKLNRLNKILKISKLVGDKVNLQKSLDSIEKLSTNLKEDDYISSYYFHDWINHYVETEQWDKLTQFAQNQLESSDRDSSERSYENLLLWISANTSSSSDFIAELESYHSKNKLSANAIYRTLRESYGNGADLGTLYSKALQKSGRHDDAWAVATHMIALNMSNDKVYKYARSLSPEKFEKLLKELHKFDPFEERPLIWKSQLALDSGKTELAKTLIDQAIALDPSDGDQGKNSRMQAYSVLARIFEAQGNSEKAAFFDEVVVAIRSGEAADDYLNAGLISEAIDRYKKSLGHFNDAYCLQSRLALTLARNGRFDEAIPHFEKAFNLMPVSFGPRESHCFGCEGLFSDKRVHEIAERILTAFVEKNPDNPRAPYLLGLVYNEMKQYDAASTAFQKALDMDPQYFNAAQKLISTLQKNPAKAHLAQAVIKDSIAIAPYSDLNSLFRQRSDLAQAWHDAANHTDSPLELGELPLKPVTATKQYAPNSNWGSVSGIDGWTRDELLRDNQTVDAIDDL